MYDVLDGFEVFKTQCVFQQLLTKEKFERGSQPVSWCREGSGQVALLSPLDDVYEPQGDDLAWRKKGRFFLSCCIEIAKTRLILVASVFSAPSKGL